MYRAAIIFCRCDFFFSFFFHAYSQRLQTGYLRYFHAWCGLSANLECRSEMCCTRLAENTGANIRHLRTIEQLCRVISSQIRHASTMGKHVKQQYLLHMFSKYGEFRPTNCWDRLAKSYLTEIFGTVVQVRGSRSWVKVQGYRRKVSFRLKEKTESLENQNRQRGRKDFSWKL